MMSSEFPITISLFPAFISSCDNVLLTKRLKSQWKSIFGLIHFWDVPSPS